MSVDTDPLVILAQQMADDDELTALSIAGVATKAVISTVVPFGIGSAITGIFTEQGQLLWKRRIHELLTLMCADIARLKAQIAEPTYYQGEEFQALMLEAVDLERTNRHKYKRVMSARALAKSGTNRFIKEDSKEIFIRILRDLMQEDLELLRNLAQQTNDTHKGLVLKAQALERVVRAKSVNPRVYRLQGLGLVATHQRLPAPHLNGPRAIQTQGELNAFIAKALGAEPEVVMSITDFGSRFVDYLLTEQDGEKANSKG